MMIHKALTVIALGLCSTVILVKKDQVSAREEAVENVETLARGPVHEAFAQPIEEGPMKDGAMAPKPPPEPIEEQPPEVKPEGEKIQWVPGYWQWDDERGEFIWVSGIWRDPPPNRKWVPGSWREVDGNWQWVPGFWLPENQEELRYLPPPPATVEEGPSVPSPGDDYTYVPGCWMYRETRYVWRPGYWLQCRPDWVWQPAHYIYSPAGCIFVAGGWDLPWERRGVLFAPVCFAPRYRPAVWTPSYTVGLNFLQGALFVRSGYRHYCYGDYFHPQYRRWGYTPWVDYRVARHAPDPAFGYYRATSGGKNWERDLRALYVDRSEGRGERLPRTLAQQETLVKNVERDRKNVDLSRVAALRPLSQSSQPETKLVQVNREERDRQRQAATQLREAGVQRATAEKQLIAKKEAPSKQNAAPRSVPLNVPKFERKGGDAPKVESPRNVPPNLNRPSTDRPVPKVEPKIERPPQRNDPPKIEKPAPRIEQPKIERPPQRVDPPKVEKPAPKIEQPKFERPPQRVDPPKVDRPAPKIEQPKFERPAPRIEAPKIERPAPKPSAPPPQIAKPAPQPAPQARPAPPSRPIQQARPAPQPSRPIQQARPAPQQSRPAPQARPAPAPAPKSAPAPSKPSKPQGGRPRR